MTPKAIISLRLLAFSISRLKSAYDLRPIVGKTDPEKLLHVPLYTMVGVLENEEQRGVIPLEWYIE